MEVIGTSAARAALLCFQPVVPTNSEEERKEISMQSIVLTRRRTEAFHESEYTPKRLEAEAEAVRRLYMDGLVRQIWHRGDIGGPCLLTEAPRART